MADKSTPKDAGTGEVQKEFKSAQDQGFLGSKVDPLPNSAHSLESGPHSPTVEEQRAALADAQSKASA